MEDETDSLLDVSQILTLRDRFALAALQGIMAKRWNAGAPSEDRAREAYEVADAMMVERLKGAQQ